MQLDKKISIRVIPLIAGLVLAALFSLCLAIWYEKDAVAGSIISSAAALCAAYVAWIALNMQVKNREDDKKYLVEKQTREYAIWLFISIESHYHNSFNAYSFANTIIGVEKEVSLIILEGLRNNFPMLPEALYDKSTYFYIDKDAAVSIRELMQTHNLYRQYLLISGARLHDIEAKFVAKFSAKTCLQSADILESIAPVAGLKFNQISEATRAELEKSAEMTAIPNAAPSDVVPVTQKYWSDWLARWGGQKLKD